VTGVTRGRCAKGRPDDSAKKRTWPSQDEGKRGAREQERKARKTPDASQVETRNERPGNLGEGYLVKYEMREGELIQGETLAIFFRQASEPRAAAKKRFNAGIGLDIGGAHIRRQL